MDEKQREREPGGGRENKKETDERNIDIHKIWYTHTKYKR